MKFVAQTEKDLLDISAKILSKAPKKQKNTATIIGLYGDLGSGKTTFTKYFAQHLGISADKIISPTFIIQKRFDISNSDKFKNLYHLDVYRIKNPDEILKLGWAEIISDPTNLILIEWADLIEEILPDDTLKINFETINENSRELNVNFENK